MPPVELTAASCPALQDIGSICGPVGVEDLAPLPGTDWLVGGGLNLGKSARFHAIHVESLRAYALDWEAAEAFDANCPAPPEKSAISINGVALRESGGGTITLYAANHGDRNAVEIFEISRLNADAVPSLVWTGCIPLPARGAPNAIAVLDDGALAISLFPDITDAAELAKLEAGEASGSVQIWSRQVGLREIDLGTVSGPNGLHAPADEHVLYISDWAGRRLVAYDLASDDRAYYPLPFMPDNIHEDGEGALLIAGQDAAPRDIAACAGPVCRQEWAVIRFDRTSGEYSQLLSRQGVDEASYAASAITAGGRLFVTVRGDGRVLYAPAD